MRKLKQKLQAADRKMAQKVARMEKTREEVGYVKRLTEEAGREWLDVICTLGHRCT